MAKQLCKSCGHIGYLVYLHNDEHCEKCYSRNTVVWEDEVKEPRKVLVKSELGMLGAIEGKVMWLMETGYDIDNGVTLVIITLKIVIHKVIHIILILRIS